MHLPKVMFIAVVTNSNPDLVHVASFLKCVKQRDLLEVLLCSYSLLRQLYKLNLISTIVYL